MTELTSCLAMMLSGRITPQFRMNTSCRKLLAFNDTFRTDIQALNGLFEIPPDHNPSEPSNDDLCKRRSVSPDRLSTICLIATFRYNFYVVSSLTFRFSSLKIHDGCGQTSRRSRAACSGETTFMKTPVFFSKPAIFDKTG